jgi:hypothetical protein
MGSLLGRSSVGNQGIYKRLVRSWRLGIADGSDHRCEIGAGFQHLTLVPYLTSFLESYKKYPPSLASLSLFFEFCFFILTFRFMFRLSPQDILLVKAGPWLSHFYIPHPSRLSSANNISIPYLFFGLAPQLHRISYSLLSVHIKSSNYFPSPFRISPISARRQSET